MTMALGLLHAHACLLFIFEQLPEMESLSSTTGSIVRQAAFISYYHRLFWEFKGR
jgi:hypothetical protein